MNRERVRLRVRRRAEFRHERNFVGLRTKHAGNAYDDRRHAV